jgi:hypothetical protein
MDSVFQPNQNNANMDPFGDMPEVQSEEVSGDEGEAKPQMGNNLNKPIPVRNSVTGGTAMRTFDNKELQNYFIKNPLELSQNSQISANFGGPSLHTRSQLKESFNMGGGD